MKPKQRNQSSYLGKILGFVLCLSFKLLALPFKVLAAVLRFCLGTKSLGKYFEDYFEEKGLRQVMKTVGKPAAFVQAARTGHKKMVEELLKSGVPVDVHGLGGETALMAAASTGQVEVCCVLLQAGADVNRRDREGRTPLNWAASMGQLKVMRFLLEAGADANARDESDGHTPLLALLAQPHSEWLYVPAVEALLKAGADPSIRGKDGRSALDWARGRRVVELARMLGDPSFVARNDLTHDVFGAITYHSREEVWRGQAHLPLFAEYGNVRNVGALSEPTLDFYKGLFPLTLRDKTGDGPTLQQANTFQFLKQNEAQVCQTVMAVLLKCATFYDDQDPGPKKYKTAADLKPAARCVGLEFSTLHAGAYAYCGFSFETDWELEHGAIMVVFHPEKEASWGDASALDEVAEADNIDEA